MTGRIDVGGMVAGLLFLALGGMFLLDRLGVWSMRPDVVWPLVLVAVGASTVLSAMLRRT